MGTRSVRLARIPDGLVFPEIIRDRIHYDAASRRLEFRGCMSKCEYDRLAKLSPDLEYHRALDDLFVEASFQSTRSLGRIAAGVALIASLLGVCVAVWRFFS